MPILEEVLDKVVRKTCVELFSAYGQGISFLGKTEKACEDLSGMAGMVGFFGMKLRGTITLLVKEDVLELTGPDYEKSDWVAELSNQLLGRLKRKLRPYEVDLWIGTPIAVEGEHLRVSFKTKLALQYEFTLRDAGPNVKVILFVDALVRQSIEPKTFLLKDDDEIEEGELRIF